MRPGWAIGYLAALLDTECAVPAPGGNGPLNCNIDGGKPNMRREVRERCAASAKPASFF